MLNHDSSIFDRHVWMWSSATHSEKKEKKKRALWHIIVAANTIFLEGNSDTHKKKVMIIIDKYGCSCKSSHQKSNAPFDSPNADEVSFFFLPCLFPLPRFGLFFCVCVMLVFFKAKQSQKEEKQIELFFPLFFFVISTSCWDCWGLSQRRRAQKGGHPYFHVFFCTRKLIFRAPATSSHRIIKKKEERIRIRIRRKGVVWWAWFFVVVVVVSRTRKCFLFYFVFCWCCRRLGLKSTAEHSSTADTHIRIRTQKDSYSVSFLRFFFWQTRHSEKCSSPLKKKEEKKKA